MRLALVIYGELDQVSGGYLYDRMLVKSLRAHGDEVDIVATSNRGYLRNLGQNWDGSVARRLLNGRYDAILQDELNHPSLVWMNRWLRAQGGPPIVGIVHHLRSDERNDAIRGAVARLLERRYLATLDAVVANSATTAARVRAFGYHGPLLVAPPAADRFERLPDEPTIVARAAAPGPLQIAFVGNIIPRKGLHTLFAALARVPRDRWRLSVIGSKTVDPVYARYVGGLLAPLKIAFYVQFLGPLTDDDLAARLAQTHLVIVPSILEGFGIVYLEAMAFGAPPIATTAGGAAEFITHGHDGVLAPPDDPDTIAHWVRALSDDRQRLAAMSVAARQRFRRRPTWEQTCAAIRAFVTEGIAQWNRSRVSASSSCP